MSNVFIILGMHRSATSAMARGLFAAGVHMGDCLLGPAEDNPQGFFEDVDFVLMNEAILKAAGGSWDDPPSPGRIIRAGKSMDGGIATLIDAKSRRDCWGFKDPRTALTIGCYLPHLSGHQLFFQCCFRDPMRVAASLSAREGMTIDTGLKLAGIYNSRILEFMGEWTSSQPS